MECGGWGALGEGEGVPERTRITAPPGGGRGAEGRGNQDNQLRDLY